MIENNCTSSFDASDVCLSEEQKELVELLAEELHEKWAQNRISEGWTYGPVRNDKERQTPFLVPYGQLPEEEKDYDRAKALEYVRKAIIKKRRSLPIFSIASAGSTM